MKKARIALLSIALIFGIWLIFHKSEKKAPPCENCNVVVILIDTLRADHLPTYGHKRDTAPFLTTLMDKSIVFEKAFSASSWTAPATASVFTSALPSDHGVITGFTATQSMIKRGSKIKMNSLPKDYEVLGETMKKAGYITIAVTDNLNIGTEIGFDRGFDYFKKLKEKGSVKVNKFANEFLEQAKNSGPYFLYLHYMDVHAPYLEHSPWYEECASESDGSVKEKMICAYDSEIRFLDGQIAKMFEKHKWLENSIVMVLADHGEEFWEHGDKGHARTLYTEVIHVPFSIYHPKLPATRISANVHTMDLLPTLASMVNIGKLEQWQGKNLIPKVLDRSFKNRRVIYSERLRTPYSKSKWWRRSAMQGKDHYILTQEPDQPDIHELFNLEEDFKEFINIYGQQPQIAKELNDYISILPNAESVQNQKLQDQGGVDVDLDEKLFKQLKTLGYVG